MRQAAAWPVNRPLGLPLQVSAIGTAVLGKLLGEWGLVAELAQLRATFLLAAPTPAPWADALFARLGRGERLSAIPAVELQLMLQNAQSGVAAGAGQQRVDCPLVSISGSGSLHDLAGAVAVYG